MLYTIQTPRCGDPWENLATAIVIQAANEYLRTKDKEPLRRFFRSQWYKELTDVDGEYLIHTLDNYTKNEVQKEELIKRAKQMRAQGIKIVTIAKELGIHYETCRTYLKQED